jgi:hypothetical protein
MTFWVSSCPFGNAVDGFWMFLQSAHSHVFHWRKEPTPLLSMAFHSTRVAFQAPVTIGSGIAECSQPQTNVLNLAPMGAYK